MSAGDVVPVYMPLCYNGRTVSQPSGPSQMTAAFRTGRQKIEVRQTAVPSPVNVVRDVWRPVFESLRYDNLTDRFLALVKRVVTLQ